MSNTQPCPERSQLEALVQGALSAEHQHTLTEHIESCRRCQAALDTLAPAGSSWADLAPELAAAATNDLALRRVLDQAKQGSRHDETQAEGSDGREDWSFLSPPTQAGSLGQLDHYDIQKLIGKGGMGIVFKAFDEVLHRVVAIKALLPQLATGTARKRFIREAKAAAAIRDEHVINIHAINKEVPYLVMEYIGGQSLQEKLDKHGPLELKEVLRIGMQTAKGLASAHAQGLVHRDIKPANILLENGIERVKITDFGLARAVDDASLTQSGVIAGTPMYMSPEQASGEALDHRSDLFSLGSVLYAMCTGHPPFRATSTVAVLRRVADDTARPIREINPELPDWLETIITRLHAKKPAERIPSATEVADLLGQYLAHLQQPGKMPAPVRIAKPVAVPKKRHSLARKILIGTGGFLTLLGVLFGLAAWFDLGIYTQIMRWFGANPIAMIHVPEGGSVVVQTQPTPFTLAPDKLLEHFKGVWATEITDERGAAPVKHSGVVVIEPIAGGRFTRWRSRTSDGFHDDLQVMGFDREQWETFGYYFNFRGLVNGPARGRFDTKSQSLTITGPPDDKISSVKNFHFIDADTIRWSLLMRDQDGNTTADMKGEMKRQKQPQQISEQTSDPGPLPDEMKVLDRLVGDWELVETKRAPAAPVETTAATNKKVLGGRLVELREDISNGESNYHLVTYDAKLGSYRFWHFSSRWTPSHALGSWDENQQVMMWTAEKPMNRVKVGWHFLSRDHYETKMQVWDTDSGDLVVDQEWLHKRRGARIPELVKTGSDEQQLQGKWLGVMAETNGKPLDKTAAAQLKMEFSGSKVSITQPGFQGEGTFQLDPTANPKRIDVTRQEGANRFAVMRGIYELMGNRLKICLGEPEDKITAFVSRPGSKIMAVELGRSIDAEMAVFKQMLGKWEVKQTLNREPVAGGSAARFEAVAGGRYIRGLHSDARLGYEHLLVQTYDEQEKKYRAWHFESDGGHTPDRITGTWDSARKVLTYKENLAAGDTSIEFTFSGPDMFHCTRLQRDQTQKIVNEHVMTYSRVPEDGKPLPGIKAAKAPAPEMAVLNRLNGAWRSEQLVKTPDRAEPVKQATEYTAMPVLAGHFIEGREHTTTLDRHDYWLSGYDLATGKYRFWYFDGLGTGNIALMEGSWNEAAQTLHWQNQYLSGPCIFRSPDEHDYTFVARDHNGRLVLEVEIVYKRIEQQCTEPVLKQMFGKWSVSQSLNNGPMTGGSARFTSVAGGRFVRGNFVSETLAYERLLVRGYDDKEMKYRFWDFDSEGGSTLVSGSGTWDAARKVLTYKETFTDGEASNEITFMNADLFRNHLVRRDQKGGIVVDMTMTFSRVPEDGKPLPGGNSTTLPVPAMKVFDRIVGIWRSEYLMKTLDNPNPTKMSNDYTAQAVLNGHFIEGNERNAMLDASDYWITGYDKRNERYRYWRFGSKGGTAQMDGNWDMEAQSMQWQAKNTKGSWLFRNPDERAYTLFVSDDAGRTLFEADGVWKRVQK